MGQFKRRKYRLKESQDLESGTTHEEEIQPKIPQDLKGRVEKKKNQKEFRNMKRWRLFQHQMKKSKIYHLDIKPQIKLVGEEIKIAKHRTTSFYVNWDYITVVGETND